MLVIPLRIREKMVTLSKKKPDCEICGYLAGNDNKVTAIYPMINTDESKEHYSMKVEEQFAVVKDIRKKGLKLLAVYHSHPATPARMSEEDIRLANDFNIIYVICSLVNDLIKAFKVCKKNGIKQVSEVQLGE